MDNDRRRLLARAVKAEDDAQHLRERLAACYQEVAETRGKLPVYVRQVSFDAPSVPVASDPLVRLFAALAQADGEADADRAPRRGMPDAGARAADGGVMESH